MKISVWPDAMQACDCSLLYRSLLQILICLTGVCGSGLLWAACTEDTCRQGEESSGDIRITVYPADRVRLWGVNNMRMEEKASGNIRQQQPFCAYSSTGAGRISIVSKNSMHMRGYRGTAVPYRMRVRNIARGGWQDIVPGAPLTFQLEETLDPTIRCVGQTNMRLRVEMNKDDYLNLLPDYYSDIVTMTLGPD